MNVTFRLWNPKAKQWATVIVRKTHTGRVDDNVMKHHEVEALREGTVDDGWSYNGHARVAIFVYDPENDEGWLRISAKDDTRPRGQGWGLTAYLGAALAAGCMGFLGVYSVPGHRSDEAARLWETMLRHGIAEAEDWDGEKHRKNVLYAERVRDLYDKVPGVKLACK